MEALSLKKNGFANLILGIAVLIAGIVMLFLPKGAYRETEAHVNRVEEYETKTGDTGYRVYASYVVDGKTYDVEYEGHASLQAGDTEILEYNIENPENFHAAGADTVPFVFMAFGAMFIIIGLIPIIKNY